LRTTGEFAKSMSPEMSKIVVLSLRRVEICTVSSPSENAVSLRQILDEAQPVRGTLARELHGIHGLTNEVQSQSAGAYFIERPALELARVNRWTAVTKQDFEPLLNLSIVSALRSPKVHRDGLVKSIAVRMADDVGQGFIDRARNRPALRDGESQSFGQAFNRSAHYR
jgi:hypothetical protein